MRRSLLAVDVFVFLAAVPIAGCTTATSQEVLPSLALAFDSSNDLIVDNRSANPPQMLDEFTPAQATQASPSPAPYASSVPSPSDIGDFIIRGRYVAGTVLSGAKARR